ncbi:MAG: ABC transporter ATP-binding protein [Rikenellaceae bacterium]
MLECRGIYKNFGDLAVIQGVDLCVSQSEIISIVGSSGAGKTTLLQIMGTLLAADRGEVILEGVNLTTLDKSQLARVRNQKIGFVFQFHHLLPEFSALENVMIPALIGGLSRGEAKAQATELLKMVNLMDRASHKPSTLSGGEQQRVAIARALINRPKVIFADEPSGNLDSRNREELHQLIYSVREQSGTAFVIVTHDQLLAEAADRMITLKDGRICK